MISLSYQYGKVDDDMNDTKKIKCPECGDNNATLYLYPSKFAGIWECEKCECSDSCEHQSTRIEEATEDYYDPGNFYGHGQRTSEVYVCNDCECTVDGDPAEDRAEALADMQLMEALGK